MRASTALSTLVISFLIFVLGPGLVAHAFGSTSANLTPWRVISFPGIPPAMFARIGPSEFEIKTAGGAGILYREFETDFPSGSCATWHWRVDKAAPPTDLGTKGQDDRSAAIHFWFPSQKDGWLNRFADSVDRFMSGVPFKGKSLTYVWGGDAPLGTQISNPFLEEDGVIFTLRTPVHAETRDWQRERVNLADDFMSAFGYAPSQPIYIAISADSDDTETSTLSYIKDLELTPRCE